MFSHQPHTLQAVLLGMAAAGIVLTPLAARAQSTPPLETVKMIERTLNVSGLGHTTAIPDRAAISTGVQTDADTAREAMSRNTAAMGKLIDGLKALGIEAKDIQTVALNVNPRYTNPGNTGKAPVISGYVVNNQVRILVRDIKKLGEVLDAALTLGANQMNGLAFEVSNADGLKDEARKLAVANARHKAELLATAAGAALGPVLAIAEDVRFSQPRQVMLGARAAMSADAVPVEAGSASLDATVNITYALK